MITHNFSFYGAGGRVSRLDASRIYSTPLTTQAEKDYSIDVDLSEYGQLAAVTLDGRLWLFQDANSLDFVALRWDSSKGQMVFAETLHFDGEGDTVLARGLDWILTNRNIFMVNDSAPYIRQASLFDKNIPSTFLYSALRHSSVPVSGADPFTKQAWGKRDDNGNSGGNARFSRDTHLLYPAGTHTFEQCYSLLPAVGDWIIFENFLIRRPDNPLTEHFNYMLNVRPLIPLELLDEGAAAFGTGYNFDHRGIQLAYLNGQLWGRGLYHIGRVLILPAAFDQHGETQEFYLYICNDFKPPDNPSGFHLSQAVHFKNFEEHTFAFFSDSTAWPYAEALCRLMGGHLATSTSAQKNSFLTSLEFSGWVCIGGFMDHFSYQWQWVTGELWDFDNWRTTSYYLSDGERLCVNSNGLWDRCNDRRSDISGYICEWDYILSQQEQEEVYSRWLNVALASLGKDNPYGFVSAVPMPVTGGACVASGDASILDTSDDSPAWLSLSDHHGKLFFDYPNLDALLLDDEGAQVFNNGITPALDYKGHTLRQWLAPADKVEAVSEAGVAASADSVAFFSNFQRGFHREVFSPCSLPLSDATYMDEQGQYVRLSAATQTQGLDFKHSLSTEALPTCTNWEDIYREHLKLHLMYSFDKGSVPSRFTGNFSVAVYVRALKSDLVEDWDNLDADFSDWGISHSEYIPSNDLPAIQSALFQWPYLLGEPLLFLPIYVTGSQAHYVHFFVCEVYYEDEDITRIQFFQERPYDFYDKPDKYLSCWEADFLQSIDIVLSYFDFNAGSWKSSHIVCPCDFFINQDNRSAIVSFDTILVHSNGILLLYDENGIYVVMNTYSQEFWEADPAYASYVGNASLYFKRIASLPGRLQKYANTGDCFSAMEYRPAEIVVDGNGWYRWTGRQTRERTYPSGETYTEEISYYPDFEKRKHFLFPSVEIVTPIGSDGYTSINSLTFRVIENGILASLSLPAAVRFAFGYQQFYTYIDHNNTYVDAQGFRRSKTNFHFLYHFDGLLVLRSDYDPDALSFNVTEVTAS